MAVPGQRIPDNAPRGLAESELFAVDAYLRDFESPVAEVDAEQGRIALRRTAFFPGGGGQPFDLGTVEWADGASEVTAPVAKVGRDRETGVIWHWLEGDALPDPGTEVSGVLDWDRRHLTMRTHTALHILCGVIWTEFGLAVTGGNMDPGRGRLDFRHGTFPGVAGRAPI